MSDKKITVNPADSAAWIACADGYIKSTSFATLQKFAKALKAAKDAGFSKLQFYHAVDPSIPAAMDITKDGEKLTGSALTAEFQRQYPRYNAFNYMLRKATQDAKPAPTAAEKIAASNKRKNAPKRIVAIALKYNLSLDGLSAILRELGKFVTKENEISDKVESEYKSQSFAKSNPQGRGKTQAKGNVRTIRKAA
jgi:hypothetical protein